MSKSDENLAMETSASAYWRGVEEYANTPEFRRRLEQEFSDYDPSEIQSMSRRSFLSLAAASMALAGLTLTGCHRWPKEEIVPFAVRPEGSIPGEPEYFASIYELSGVAQPVLVKSYDGRPIKVEGNETHPTCHGASTKYAQASLLNLYDPARARTVTMQGKNLGDAPQAGSWKDFTSLIENNLKPMRDNHYASSLAVLATPSSSATRMRLRQQFEQAYPGHQWIEWEPVSNGYVPGQTQVNGKNARPIVHLDRAKVIACFDADPLETHPDAMNLSRGWADGRRTADTDGKMNRLYVVEPGFTVTGSVADERLPVKPSKVLSILQGLAHELGVDSVGSVSLNGSTDFVKKLAKDLKAADGHVALFAGPSLGSLGQTLVHAIHDKLHAIGQDKPVQLVPETLRAATDSGDQLKKLAEDIKTGTIKHLIILGGNPAYDAPADVPLADALTGLTTSIHLSESRNETSSRCHMHLPEAHWLESWGDARAWDGTLSVQQPLILPLFENGDRSTGGRSVIEVLSLLIDPEHPKAGRDLVREAFEQGNLFNFEISFEKAWRTALHTGFAEGTSLSTIDSTSFANEELATADAHESSDWEVSFHQSVVYDGRFANNGWLQELPQPLTMVTWNNPVTIGYGDAKKLGIKSGDMVRVTVGSTSIEGQANLTFGQARGAITLTLGYGRSMAGPVGSNVGIDTYTLRSLTGLHHAPAKFERVGKGSRLALTSEHHLVNEQEAWAMGKRLGKKPGKGGYILKEAFLKDYVANPDFIADDDHLPYSEHGDNIPLQLWEPPSVLDDGGFKRKHEDGPKYFNEPHAWGMAIDMNSCTGCSACVVACQAENNIPVVGEEQVLMSREMHWLRIDRYFKGKDKADDVNVEVRHMPVACVHCENAPCEQVCPVAATVHDTEGLNTMIYNRCIGTRYCSNNCPYKVRRFNYFDYHARSFDTQKLPWLGMPDQEQNQISQITRMVFNPDVTVRMRGVMEKCTYCTQRISQAKIHADNAHQRGERDTALVQDGDLQTACQQSCPTGAIVFGDLNDPNSRVSQIVQHNPRSYGLLNLLNTRPRTSHLAKLTNPAKN